MKKVLYVLAAALFAVVACKKADDGKTDPTPDPTPSVPELTLTTPKIVDVDAESSIYTVKFGATKAWTATLSYPDGSESGAVLDKSKGDAGDELNLRVTFNGLTEEQLGRLTKLDLKAGETTESILFFQGLVFWSDAEQPNLGVEGGDFKLHILTNMEYTVKKYDGAEEAFPWAPVTITEDKAAHTLDLAFKVAKNEGYDPRTAYVKFTLPEVQDPVLDEEGTPTGETTDHVARFYLKQEGHSKEEWRTYLAEPFNVGDGATHTLAFFNGKLLVSDSKKVYTVNPETGAFDGELATGDLPIQSIANDDEGNLLFANLGDPTNAIFDVYAVKANDTKLEKPVKLIHFINDNYTSSTGIDKVAAKGNVFGDGVVSAMYGGVGSSGYPSYTLYWAITGGKAKEEFYNEWNPVVNPSTGGWLTTPELGDDLWLSNRAAFVPAGASVSDGFFYGGYDGLYNVYYYDGTGWQVSVEGVGDWAGGPQGLKVTTWNGKKILIIAQMGYVWWSEGWGMPAYLWVVDVTTPTAPTVMSKAEYTSPDQIISGDTENSTVDVLPVIDGNDLLVYYLDASHGQLIKVRFPKL